MDEKPPRIEGISDGTGAGSASGSRTSGMWMGMILSALVLIFLLIFILQNRDLARITFLGVVGNAAHGCRAALRRDRRGVARGDSRQRPFSPVAPSGRSEG